jgi:hypothetical protein
VQSVLQSPYPTEEEVLRRIRRAVAERTGPVG